MVEAKMEKMKIEVEHTSVEAFVQFCMDEDRTEFTHVDLAHLSYTLHSSPSKIRVELEGYGLRLAVRPNEKKVRGFTTSSHDRWYGPGACKTYGGCGIDPHTGRATAKGAI